MKKRILTLTMLLLTAVFTAEANPVDMRTAREVAVKFMNANAKTPLRSTDDLQWVTTYNISRGDAAFHIFNTPNGFVIVSADDCAKPILAYSDEGPFDADDIPIQLQDYFQGFVNQIQYGIENHLEADEATARQWEMVRAIGHLIEQRATTAVAPLLTDTWSQGCYYNNKCPSNPNGPCGHVVTGCVATSFAQILHYWGYPTKGMGSHTYTPYGYPQQTANFGATTYDWANMPNSLSSSSSSTQVDAVSTLMWHCGVAVDMDYGPYGSGASSSYIPSALLNYFGYSNELSIVYRDNYTDSNWLALMKSCLDLSCPIHYRGSDANGGGGHAFVCDGYDSNDFLHFNWGWGGTSNGYFANGALNVQGYAFNVSNAAIINIRPGCTAGTTYQITATTDPSNGGTVSGAGTYDCGETCTLTATAIGDYSFMYWTEDGEQVSSEASYSFIAMNDRNLVAHFGLPFNITTSANPAAGGTVSEGGICHYNQQVTLTATPNEGYVFYKWTKDGVDFSYLSTLNMNVTEPAEYVAYFEPVDGIVIGNGTNANGYLPSYYYYSLTQQIYTASEMGGTSTEISSVSFFNTNNYSSTRNWNVYMVNTDKASFESNSDWIPVSENDLVFSGSITMTAHNWTTVYFSTPFLYDGSSNVALIVDDNSKSYTISNCRTFGTEDNQAICVYGNSDYDPYNTTGYTGTRMNVKNQVIFGIPSYDYTVTASVGSEGGGTVSGGGLCYLNQPITLTAIPNEGYIFSHWAKNGTIVSYTSKYNLTVTASAEYVAHFELKPEGIVIGDGTYTSSYLPTYYYNSLTQQIYTSNEMGGTAVEISSVSFFNTGSSSRTRNWNVYLVHTDKTSFTGTSDWIPVSENDLVFTGDVTLTSRSWVTVCFNTPFQYDGTSNVALIVDDNSSSYNLSTSCRTFGTEGNQAIRIYGSNGTDYDPTNPSGYTGTLMTEKNQVVFRQPKTVTATANPVEGGTVSGGGIYPYGMTCTLTATPNAGYYFLNWTEDGGVVTYDADYSFTVNGDRNLVANFVEGESTYTIVFDLHVSYQNGWSGNYLVVDYSDGTSEQFTLENGSSASYSREVATGSTINLSWIEGTYANRCSFDIKFENDVPIYHGSSLNANFQQELYVNCATATAPRTITAVADPIEGGVVEGAGTYESGTVVTLTATPNVGYTFCFWLENGQQVSTNATYSFLVTSDRNLEARFTLPLAISVTPNIAEGGTTTGAGSFDYGSTCTLSATPNEGYLFLNWSKNGEVVSCNATYSFAVTEEAEIEAIFMPIEGILIGQGESSNESLPSHSYWRYSLSQQIYTPDEIGTAGSITSISYFNAGYTQTRKYNIYLVHTSKTTFDNNKDWIPVTEADLVFSGNVVMTKGYWTTIVLDTPFAYDGTSNLAIVIDDNMGYYYGGMACRVFNSQGYQSIRVYSDNTNYDPYNPSEYSGTRFSVKNQIILGINTPAVAQTITLSQGWNLISTYLAVEDPVGMLDMLEASLGENATGIQSEDYMTEYDGEEWFGDLDEIGLANEKGYFVNVINECTVVLTGAPANVGDYEIPIHKGWNFIGFPSAEAIEVNAALAGFEAAEGDRIQTDYGMTEYDGEWFGDMEAFEPGFGIMYYSNSDEEKTLIFQTGAKAKADFSRGKRKED